MKQKDKDEENGVIEFFERAKKNARALDEEVKAEKESVKVEKEFIKVDKENLTTMEEKPQPFAHDPVTGDEINLDVVKREEHHAPGVYSEHHEVVEVKKKLEPKYDYTAEYAFKEKDKS
jgi:hypothetical protein